MSNVFLEGLQRPAILPEGTSPAPAPTGTLEISENGTYDVTEYASAEVEVENEPQGVTTIILESQSVTTTSEYEYYAGIVPNADPTGLQDLPESLAVEINEQTYTLPPVSGQPIYGEVSESGPVFTTYPVCVVFRDSDVTIYTDAIYTVCSISADDVTIAEDADIYYLPADPTDAVTVTNEPSALPITFVLDGESYTLPNLGINAYGYFSGEGYVLASCPVALVNENGDWLVLTIESGTHTVSAVQHTDTIIITENGTNIDVADYTYADVNVNAGFITANIGIGVSGISEVTSGYGIANNVLSYDIPGEAPPMTMGMKKCQLAYKAKGTTPETYGVKGVFSFTAAGYTGISMTTTATGLTISGSGFTKTVTGTVSSLDPISFTATPTSS